MRDLLPQLLSGSSASKATSWPARVRENLRQLLTPVKISPSAANSAPIHLLKDGGYAHPLRSQSVSIFTHAVAFALIALLLAHPRGNGKNGTPPIVSMSTLEFPPDLLRAHPSTGGGQGGDRNPIPALRGDLPRRASIQLVRPSLPTAQSAIIMVPPTILDPTAPPVLTPVDHLGLPWMTVDTNSAGPGKGHSIGSRDGHGIGDLGDGLGGDGNSSQAYAPGVTAPICKDCPYPTYSDEGRRAKVQGSVLLQVLVGADGKASAIRLAKGLGMGLDEQAVNGVRNWRFIPAYDASHRPVPRWITVEVVFRLF